MAGEPECPTGEPIRPNKPVFPEILFSIFFSLPLYSPSFQGLKVCPQDTFVRFAALRIRYTSFAGLSRFSRGRPNDGILFFLSMAFHQKKDFIKNHITGTNKDGSMFRALQSFIFNMERPELKIRKPPTSEISVNSWGVKKEERMPEKK